jgi:hypothetical protein
MIIDTMKITGTLPSGFAFSVGLFGGDDRLIQHQDQDDS